MRNFDEAIRDCSARIRVASWSAENRQLALESPEVTLDSLSCLGLGSLATHLLTRADWWEGGFGHHRSLSLCCLGRHRMRSRMRNAQAATRKPLRLEVSLESLRCLGQHRMSS